MLQQKPGKHPSEELVSDKGFKYLFLPALSLSVAAHLLSVYWGTPFLWGFHFLHFFPRWLGWVLTVVTLGLLVFPVNNLILRNLESFIGWAERIRAGTDKHMLFASAGIFSLPMFWFVRTRLFLLGDGYFKLESLALGHITKTERLDAVVHLQLYRLLTNLFPNADPSLAYTVPSVLCGGVFIFLILVLADLLGKSSFQRILVFSLLVSLGSIQLFFGYVESYTTLLVAVTLLTLLSLLFLQGKISIILPFLALALNPYWVLTDKELLVQ